jgi:hypothetical protein
MSKHTAGPWAIEAVRLGPSNSIIEIRIAKPELGGAIADVYANCLVTTDAECYANARLIFAAPDLLAALKEAIVVIEKIKPATFGNGTLIRGRRAIEKATGEPA